MENLGLNLEDFKGSGIDKGFVNNNLEKGKAVPVGTVSNGYKKMAEGKWVPVKEGGSGYKENKPSGYTDNMANKEDKMQAAKDAMPKPTEDDKAYFKENKEAIMAIIENDPFVSVKEVIDGHRKDNKESKVKQAGKAIKKMANRFTEDIKDILGASDPSYMPKDPDVSKGETNLGLNTDHFKGSGIDKGMNGLNDIEKGKKVPVGTITNGYKKVREGKWVPVKKQGKKADSKAVPTESTPKTVEDYLKGTKMEIFDYGGHTGEGVQVKNIKNKELRDRAMKYSTVKTDTNGVEMRWKTWSDLKYSAKQLVRENDREKINLVAKPGPLLVTEKEKPQSKEMWSESELEGANKNTDSKNPESKNYEGDLTYYYD